MWSGSIESNIIHTGDFQVRAHEWYRQIPEAKLSTSMASIGVLCLWRPLFGHVISSQDNVVALLKLQPEAVHCERLTVRCFAHACSQGLEEDVLQELKCHGPDPTRFQKLS